MSKRNVIALDLETIPDKTMIPFLPEVKPNGSLKDEAKIAADIAKKKAKQLEEMGLNPLTNIICCAGWCDEEGTGHIILKDEQSEKGLLEEFWEKVSTYDHFVTFNGRNFDMRCILLHCMDHGVRPSTDIDTGRYNRGNHTDLRLILSGDNQFAAGKLDFYAQKFLKDKKTEGIDGKLVQEYWAIGAKGMIAEYCEQDCKLTYDLYKMAEIAGLITA